MTTSQISAMENILLKAAEEFFEPLTEADMYSFVCAPYREAQESFERELAQIVTSELASI